MPPNRDAVSSASRSTVLVLADVAADVGHLPALAGQVLHGRLA